MAGLFHEQPSLPEQKEESEQLEGRPSTSPSFFHELPFLQPSRTRIKDSTH